jgi:hypothetical protein
MTQIIHVPQMKDGRELVSSVNSHTPTPCYHQKRDPTVNFPSE